MQHLCLLEGGREAERHVGKELRNDLSCISGASDTFLLSPLPHTCLQTAFEDHWQPPDPWPHKAGLEAPCSLNSSLDPGVPLCFSQTKKQSCSHGHLHHFIAQLLQMFLICAQWTLKSHLTCGNVGILFVFIVVSIGFLQPLQI